MCDLLIYLLTRRSKETGSISEANELPLMREQNSELR